MLEKTYAFVLYDISSEQLGKVFKICKKYFKHHQKSIFRGHITTANLIKFKDEVKNTIEQDKDFITVITMFNVETFDEETIGTNKKQNESIFI